MSDSMTGERYYCKSMYRVCGWRIDGRQEHNPVEQIHIQCEFAVSEYKGQVHFWMMSSAFSKRHRP